MAGGRRRRPPLCAGTGTAQTDVPTADPTASAWISALQSIQKPTVATTCYGKTGPTDPPPFQPNRKPSAASPGSLALAEVLPLRRAESPELALNGGLYRLVGVPCSPAGVLNSWPGEARAGSFFSEFSFLFPTLCLLRQEAPASPQAVGPRGSYPPNFTSLWEDRPEAVPRGTHSGSGLAGCARPRGDPPARADVTQGRSSTPGAPLRVCESPRWRRLESVLPPTKPGAEGGSARSVAWVQETLWILEKPSIIQQL
ncbi:uncharacterized protein LOC117088298 [Trachypithecus francoisi]|uniref:uncharacterized protein LOC117088298 n=1 Tax=Trachypithecus francoisi TaxID=54180 RepID=UPI00141A6826|nr:uncharacterized protein LOC117088298 [Trachypithecus francoisi]